MFDRRNAAETESRPSVTIPCAGTSFTRGNLVQMCWTVPLNAYPCVNSPKYGNHRRGLSIRDFENLQNRAILLALKRSGAYLVPQHPANLFDLGPYT